MLCGVTATLGSNPSATATAARPHWGRAVLLCLAGVPSCCVAVPLVLLVAPRVFLAPCRAGLPCVPCRAGLLDVLVGGGPPASRPRRELRSARRLEARPGPAATHGHLSLAPLSSSNFARNSPVAYSTLNLYRWNCNVFGRSRKVTVGNYVRNLSGGGPANACWPSQPAAACTAAGSCGSSGAFRFTPVGPGVLLCWLARYLPRVRYKTLPARCFAEQSDTKLSLHA